MRSTGIRDELDDEFNDDVRRRAKHDLIVAYVMGAIFGVAVTVAVVIVWEMTR